MSTTDKKEKHLTRGSLLRTRRHLIAALDEYAARPDYASTSDFVENQVCSALESLEDELGLEVCDKHDHDDPQCPTCVSAVISRANAGWTRDHED